MVNSGWPADLEFLEESGNFVAVAKCQGISWNSEKSGNFNIKLGKVREFYLREMNIAEVLLKNKLMWMLIVIFKSCTQTPKSEKIFWKSQGILKSWNAGHPVKAISIHHILQQVEIALTFSFILFNFRNHIKNFY